MLSKNEALSSEDQTIHKAINPNWINYLQEVLEVYSGDKWVMEIHGLSKRGFVIEKNFINKLLIEPKDFLIFLYKPPLTESLGSPGRISGTVLCGKCPPAAGMVMERSEGEKGHQGSQDSVPPVGGTGILGY